MDLLRVLPDGALEEHRARARGEVLLLDNAALHEHYRDARLVLYSTVAPTSILDHPLHAFVLPPPLNMYPYPSVLYVGSATACPLTSDAFLQYCIELARVACSTHHNDAIYDVPALPTVSGEEDEDLSECEESYSQSENDSSSENDWEDEDEDIALPETR